ncbi:unnamed protein product [Paramecium octaurelia]|uniref:Uncharacterized protein n=1 Tax=Paramecium octaurelia TaxID=43137 RepID=A0A8S1XDZ8_PAROT|nr:unnamed protein product [Paramecium octaurelia]
MSFNNKIRTAIAQNQLGTMITCLGFQRSMQKSQKFQINELEEKMSINIVKERLNKLNKEI